jgi:hypothetical protein
MEEAPENGKESSHSAHVNGMNEFLDLSQCNCLRYPFNKFARYRVYMVQTNW